MGLFARPEPPDMSWTCLHCQATVGFPQGAFRLLKAFEENHALVCPGAHRPALLTPAEFAILDLLAESATRFGRLPEHHPSDREEFAGDVHRLQRQIMARSARRAYPDRFTQMVTA